MALCVKKALARTLVAAWIVVAVSNALAADAREGVVALSNGDNIPGVVSLTPGKRLRLRIAGRRRAEEYSLDAAACLEVVLRKTEHLREWRFKEEGSAVKVYTGQTYPRLHFGLRIVPEDKDADEDAETETVDGTLIVGTPISVKSDEGELRRFVLQPQLTGEAGQTAEEIVYVTRVDFSPETLRTVRAENAAKKALEEAAATEAEKKGVDGTAPAPDASKNQSADTAAPEG